MEGSGLAKGKLVYIPVPDSAAKDFARRAGFLLDPGTPLPLELPPGEGPENLAPEAFISGMLRAQAEDPQSPRSAYYRKLVTALRPDILEELRAAAVLKARNGDYDTALEIFELLEGLDPRHSGVFLDKALALEEKALALKTSSPSLAEAAYAEAEAACEKALAFPGPDTLFYAGLFYERRGEYRRAADCLRSYLGEDGGDGEKRKKAVKLLEAIKTGGLDDETFREALALIRQGREEQGIRRIREFLERRPGSGKGWFVLGWGLRRLSRWEDGAACFAKALELGTVNADTRNELAICLLETGRLDDAEKELQKALKSDPDNIKIISNMGVAAVKRGDNERAAAFFRTVLELEPADPIAAAFFAQPV